MSIDLASPAISRTASVESSGSGGSPAGAPEPVAPALSHEPSAPAASRADTADVHAAAQRLEAYARSLGRSLEFRVDSNTNRTVVTVLDTTTGEVVRQIPSDETLWLAEHLNVASSALLHASA